MPFITWRLVLAILIGAMVVVPGLVALASAQLGKPYADLAGAAIATWVLLSAATLIVSLALLYVIAYVVSAAWHDAQNVRRPH